MDPGLCGSLTIRQNQLLLCSNLVAFVRANLCSSFAKIVEVVVAVVVIQELGLTQCWNVMSKHGIPSLFPSTLEQRTAISDPWSHPKVEDPCA